MHARSLLSAAAAVAFACTLSNTGAAASTLYERLGGHRSDDADPEAKLLRRLGRRIVMLRSRTMMAGIRSI